MGRSPARRSHEYGISLIEEPVGQVYDGIVLAVAHTAFMELGVERIRGLGKPQAVFFDVKSIFPKAASDLRL